MRKNDLTKGPEWRAILAFSLPIMLGSLLQQLYSTVDGIIVGNFVSSTALAALGSCMSYTTLFVFLAMGVANGSSVVISQLFGAGQHKEMRRTASTILIMLIVLGVFFTVACTLTARAASRYILKIEGEELLGYCTTYIAIYSIGLIFQFIYNAVSAILRAVGDSRAALYFLMVATLINVVLDLLFVAVLPWGVAGAALATIIAQAACMAVSLRYMFKKYPEFRFKRFELVFDKAKFSVCLRMAIPTTIQHLVISFGHIFLQRLVNSFGAVTMAAFTVGSRYDHYASIPIMGINQAMSAFAGQNTGAGRYDRVKRGIFSALAMDLVLVVLVCVPIYIFAAPLAKLFGVSGEEVNQTVEYLRYICLCYPLFALYIPFSGMFQGCGDPMASTTASFIALVVRTSAAYIMVYAFGAGYAACWENVVFGWSGALLFDIIYYFSGRWKTKRLVK
ncbi:MAG: MATE family efflux transporter [Oscillospiraceae bacterium]|nr:MATE family efflux transporter [Oscillospiraceae bacterium]